MKIQYRKGNLFETDIYTIVHGCNAQGVMGSGVAKIIYDDYKEAYNDYREVFFDRGLTLGHIICAPSNGKMIINAITQDNFGKNGDRYVSYDAVATAMNLINRQLHTETTETQVAMPQIGAGLGGGDWSVIAAIIESEMKDIEPVVYILE